MTEIMTPSTTAVKPVSPSDFLPPLDFEVPGELVAYVNKRLRDYHRTHVVPNPGQYKACRITAEEIREACGLSQEELVPHWGNLVHVFRREGWTVMSYTANHSKGQYLVFPF